MNEETRTEHTKIKFFVCCKIFNSDIKSKSIIVIIFITEKLTNYPFSFSWIDLCLCCMSVSVLRVARESSSGQKWLLPRLDSVPFAARGRTSAADGHELYFDDDEMRSTKQNTLSRPLRATLLCSAYRPREFLINSGRPSLWIYNFAF